MVLLGGLAAFACGTGTPTRERYDARLTPPADTVAEALLRQVLAERITAGDIPDFGLVRSQRPILVRLDNASPAALPKLRGTELSSISLAEAEERARTTGRPVFYLIAGAPQIRGDTAELLLGVDVTLPPGTGAKLCCCHGQVRYVRTSERWRYVGMPYAICS
jgi:hypothetical protein